MSKERELARTVLKALEGVKKGEALDGLYCAINAICKSTYGAREDALELPVLLAELEAHFQAPDSGDAEPLLNHSV